MNSPDPRKAPDPSGKLKSLAERRAEYMLNARRGRGLAPPPKDVSHAILKALRPILKETGSSMSAVESRWAEIVGPSLAKLSQPVKIVRNKKGGAVLVIRARSAAAAKLQHIADIVIERVNLAAGKKISAIRIDQTQALHQSDRPNVALAPQLPPQEKDALVDALKDVENPKVKSALAALGEAVLARKQL